MLFVKINQLKKEQSSKVLFDIEELVIESGNRIGLIGTNGCGKTTLLNIIAGETEPDTGVVKRNTSVKLLPQLKRTDTTKSGGEVTAEYIVQALNENPQLLLADEPTTHLDTSHIKWVEEQFKAFQGSYVVVSHDRAFLDHVCETIWELNDGKLKVYSGNYSQYEAEKLKQMQHQQSEYEKYKSKERQLLEAKQKKEKQAQRATKKPKNVTNSEARITGAKPYFEKKSKKLHKVASTIDTRIEQLEKVEKPKEVEAVKMDLPNVRSFKNKIIVRATKFSGKVPGKQLWKPSDFNIKGGEKVAVIGDNGSGKTTFIRRLLNQTDGITTSPSMKIGYFAQNLSVLEQDKTILENVKDGSKQTETLIRIVLAQLHFKDQDVYKEVSVLSGGEQMKVALAKLFVGDYNTLILDEPTNFLDIQAVEALETLLQSYEGSLIIVSHDRRFISTIARKLIIIDQQQLILFDGTYEEWESRDELTQMSHVEEELMRVENELTTILSKLSIEPSKQLDINFQELLAKKKKLEKRL